MTQQHLVLWRHGRTAYNSAARLQGQVDIPLDEVGHWQARTAASRLVKRARPARVVSSDLTRAVETATYLTQAVDLPLETDPRLRERSFGEWEGLTGPEIDARWPGEFGVWRAGGDPTGVGAETRADLAARQTRLAPTQADLAAERARVDALRTDVQTLLDQLDPAHR